MDTDRIGSKRKPKKRGVPRLTKSSNRTAIVSYYSAYSRTHDMIVSAGYLKVKEKKLRNLPKAAQPVFKSTNLRIEVDNRKREYASSSEVFDLKPTSGNPGIRIEFVGWQPSRNCSTAISLSKWSVSTVCT